jgi:acetate kinase
MIAKRLEFIGLAIDETANAANARDIHASGSRVAAMVIPTDEERMIAFDTVTCLDLHEA